MTVKFVKITSVHTVGNRHEVTSLKHDDTCCLLHKYVPTLQVLQLTKEANRPMERNISSSKLGGMANGSKSASAASSSSSAAVNFIPINALEACDDNLCFNGGFCDPLSQKCRCRGHFIGKPSRGKSLLELWVTNFLPD